MEFNKIEKLKGLYACTKTWLAKSNLTTEYYEQINDLAKLVYILNNQIYATNPKACEDLFVLKCLDLEEYRQKQWAYLQEQNDDIAIEVYRRKVIAWLDSLIVFISKYMTNENLQAYLDMKLEVQNCSTDDLKETIMSIFYDYCNFDNDTLMSLKDYASSLNEDDINNAKKVNINQEFNLVNKVLSADNADETIGSNAYETEKLFFEQKLLHKMDFDIRSKAIDLALINWHNVSPDEHITTHR